MYVYIYIYIYICTYIYIYIYNPHLELINAPPLICVFPPKYICYYQLTINKARNIQNYGQDLINHISPLMGGTPLREYHMGLLYNKCYLNSNDLGVIIFQNLGCLVFVFLRLLIFGAPGLY